MTFHRQLDLERTGVSWRRYHTSSAFQGSVVSPLTLVTVTTVDTRSANTTNAYALLQNTDLQLWICMNRKLGNHRHTEHRVAEKFKQEVTVLLIYNVIPKFTINILNLSV